MAFSLDARFSVDATGVRATLKSLRRDFDDFVEKYAKLGAGAAVGAFVAMSKGAIDLAGQLSDTAQNIGINVEALQALEAQHKRNGVSNEELTKSLQKTKSAVLAAADGDEKAAAALARLGLRASDLIRLPLAEQYATIAEATAEAADQNEAYAAITALLGEKVGPKLMTSLRELGETGLPAVTASAREAGHVMSAETIVALDRAGDAIDDFKRRATIAVGEIIVNFRSEEGLKLLGLKLLKIAAEFGGSIIDFFKEGDEMVYAIWKGVFRGVLNYLQDGFVDVLQSIAGALNKLLPSKFEINVGNLDQLRSSGKSIAEEITDAVSKTSPSTFKKDFGEAWQGAIDEQQKIVDEMNEVDFGEQADQLRTAGEDVQHSIKQGGAAVADAGEEVADDISAAAEDVADAAEQLSVAVTRSGENYSEQSTAALQGVRTRLQSQRDSLQGDTSFASALAPNAKNPLLSIYETELAAVERELSYRRQVQDFTARYGESSARFQFGDRAVDSALREMQSDTRRSTLALERLTNGLTATGFIPRT